MKVFSGNSNPNLAIKVCDYLDKKISDANISKFELCEKIKKYVPGFVFFDDQFSKDEDQRNYIVSNKKIESTGFKPNYSLDDGIQELLKGYITIKNNYHGNEWKIYNLSNVI